MDEWRERLKTHLEDMGWSVLPDAEYPQDQYETLLTRSWSSLNLKRRLKKEEASLDDAFVKSLRCFKALR